MLRVHTVASIKKQRATQEAHNGNCMMYVRCAYIFYQPRSTTNHLLPFYGETPDIAVLCKRSLKDGNIDDIKKAYQV